MKRKDLLGMELGDVRDRLLRRTTNVDNIGHGAVSTEEWRMLARGVIAAKFVSHAADEGVILEVGTLSGKTTRGLLDLLENFRWYGPQVLTIDKEVSCGVVLETFKRSRITGNALLFFHGTTPKYFGEYLLPESQPPVWFAFIDGCHCEDCVCADIEAIVPFTRKGSVFAFHDAGNQRDLGMKVHERYHGDGEVRLYGVSEAIEMATNDGLMTDWNLVEKCGAWKRPSGSSTPVRGGVQVWQRS